MVNCQVYWWLFLNCKRPNEMQLCVNVHLQVLNPLEIGCPLKERIKMHEPIVKDASIL